MNANKQLRSTINSFKKNISRTSNQIGIQRKEGTFDTIATIGGKDYDLMEIIIESIYESSNAMELLKEADKILVNGAKNGDNKFISNEKIQLDYIEWMLAEIDNLYNMKAPRKLTYALEDTYFNRMVAETAGVDTDKIFNDTVANVVMLAIGVDKIERCLTNSTILGLSCMLYVLVKNGHVSDSFNIDGIKGLMKIDERLTKGCTFEVYSDWLRSFGMQPELIESFIKIRCSEELTKKQLKEHYKLCVGEYTRALECTNSKTALDSLRHEVAEEEGFIKVITSLKRNGINIIDLLVHCMVNKHSYENMCSMIANICVAYDVSRKACGEIIETAAKCIETKIVRASVMLADKSVIQYEIFTKLKESRDKQLDELNKQKDTNKKYKSQVKQMEKESRELRDQLDTQKKRNIKQVEYINGLKEKGLTDTQPLQTEIDNLKELLEVSKQCTEELKRDRNKIKTSFEQLDKQYETLKKQTEEKEQQISLLSSKAEESQSKLNSIDIECYINALRNKKITVYGGDMMHSELKGLGMKGLKLIEASNRNISMSDLAYQDLIVVVTGYMAHSTMHIPKNAAERYNVPIYYFNNKNVSMLIQEVFTAVYKDTESNN